MPRGRPRKIRVTREEVHDIMEKNRADKETSSYKRKKTVRPGPWTELPTKAEVKASLRLTKGMIGELFGTYPNDYNWSEKGWYPVIFNVTSKSIKRDIDAYGIDEYLAACEKDLNTKENQAKYGTIVILRIEVDGSDREDADNRFVSVRAKTNKKNIVGFAALRNGSYSIIKSGGQDDN